MDGAVVPQTLWRRLGAFDVHATRAEPEPGMDPLDGEGLPCEGDDVRVARCVDHGTAGDRLAARLRFDDDVGYRPAFAAKGDGPAVEAEDDAGFTHQPVGFDLELEGVVGYGVPDRVGPVTPDEPEPPVPFDERFLRSPPLVGWGSEAGPSGGEAVHHLLTEAGDHLGAAAVVEGEQEDDEAVRGEAPEGARPFEEDRSCSAASGGHGGGDAGRSSPDDEDVGGVDDRHLPLGFTEEGRAHLARYRSRSSQRRVRWHERRSRLYARGMTALIAAGAEARRSVRNAYELLVALTARDLRLRYQGSLFGWGWSLVRPLALGVVLYFALGKVLGAGIESYPAFLLTGLFPWFWFQGSVQAACGSFVGNGGLLKKVRFPRAVLPLSVVTGNTLQFLLAWPVLVLFLVVAGHLPHPFWAFAPLVFLIQFLLTAGLALLVASLTVFFRDLEHIVEVGLTFVFYGTPILYSATLIPPRFDWIVLVNPLAPIMESWRNVLLYGEWPEPTLGISAAAAAVALGVGWVTFRKLEDDFADAV